MQPLPRHSVPLLRAAGRLLMNRAVPQRLRLGKRAGKRWQESPHQEAERHTNTRQCICRFGSTSNGQLASGPPGCLL
ncbi:hypothetical protein NDU88_001922 [Pleurodeles waltl]|uniref:Uncharacterized protein n=1 Tax=Pleurodeles waltl TaxID=8319 RepID=A0AAV7U884_PLEWA|nr:hypothetical protein NDU88_001922 [Pleurodeles waltl]